MKNYSQNNEQQVIVDYFSSIENGHGKKFIDIGAFDVFKFSNTRALYEKGWNGVYVEPSPICFARFKEEYKNEMRINLINAAVSHEDGTVTFYEAKGDAISTTNIPHKEKWEKGANVEYDEITVNSISMQKFMNQYGIDTDFLSLDTEGTNYELFNLIPNDFLHRLKMICIEHDNHNNEIMNKLLGFGFKQILLNNENLIAVK